MSEESKREKYWVDKFNSLPDDIRHIACADSTYDSIRYLEREKRRLKANYNRSLEEINEHIKSHEKWLKDEFKVPE